MCADLGASGRGQSRGVGSCCLVQVLFLGRVSSGRCREYWAGAGLVIPDG